MPTAERWDSCDDFNTTALWQQKPGRNGTISSVTTATPRFPGTQAINLSSSSDFGYVFSERSEFYFGAAIYRAAAWSAAAFLKTFTDAGGTQLNCFTNASGQVYFARNNTQILPPAGGSLPAVTWGYLEFGAFIDDVAGWAEIRWNGATLNRVENVDTRNTAGRNVGIIGFGGQLVTVRDLYLADGFLGDVRVQRRRLQSGVSAQFSPVGAASNVLAAGDGTNAPVTTTYNQSIAPGNADLFVPEPLDFTPKTVFGAQVTTYAQKTDAGARQMVNRLKSGAVVAEGAAYDLPTSWGVNQSRWTVNPATGAPFTPAEANAAQIGYRDAA